MNNSPSQPPFVTIEFTCSKNRRFWDRLYVEPVPKAESADGSRRAERLGKTQRGLIWPRWVKSCRYDGGETIIFWFWTWQPEEDW